MDMQVYVLILHMVEHGYAFQGQGSLLEKGENFSDVSDDDRIKARIVAKQALPVMPALAAAAAVGALPWLEKKPAV